MNILNTETLWRILKNLQRGLIRGFFRFEESENRHSAAVLTLTTLFGAVPFLTVLSFALSWVPEMQGLATEVQARLFDHFAPATVSQLESYLEGFAKQTQKLTLIGFVFLLVTALVALHNIEEAFNKVWRVPQGRTGMQGFLLYWAVLSLGPLLVGAGFFITSYLASVPLVQSASQWSLGQRLLGYLPWVFSACAFTLLYAAVPNCKVPLRYALFGGVLVAALFEFAKTLFTLFVVSFPSYRLVYGAFAILPLFILWVYCSWCLILLGVEWVYLLTRKEYQQKNLTDEQGFLALRVLYKLEQAQKTRSWVPISELMQGLDPHQSDALVRALLAKEWVSRSDQEQLALIKNLKEISLKEALFSGPWPRPQLILEDNASPNHPWEAKLWQLLQAQDAEEAQRFSCSLSDLFAQTPR